MNANAWNQFLGTRRKLVCCSDVGPSDASESIQSASKSDDAAVHPQHLAFREKLPLVMRVQFSSVIMAFKIDLPQISSGKLASRIRGKVPGTDIQRYVVAQLRFSIQLS